MEDESIPFAAPSQFSNVTLIIEGKRIHVNKQYLGIQSSFFRRVFLYYEKDKNEVEIKFGKHEELIELLHLISPGGSLCTGSSKWHEDILESNFRFQFEMVREMAETHLLKADDVAYSVKKEIREERELRDIAVPPSFDVSSPFCNVVLLVEGRKLHVNKEYLAIHSPVFAIIFFGNFAEKDKEEIEIKDVIYEEFVDLLRVIYPGPSPITVSTISHIIRLADRFDAKKARIQAEAYLIASGEVSVETKLTFADRYNMPKLMDETLTSIPDVFSLEGLKSCPEYANLSLSSKVAISTRMVELITPEHSPAYALYTDEVKAEMFERLIETLF